MLEGKQSVVSRARRAFIKGHVGTDHIASVLVQAWPEKMPAVKAGLMKLPGVESHQSDGNGKLIVTIEASSEAALADTMAIIESSPGIINASLVYHHAEDLSGDLGDV